MRGQSRTSLALARERLDPVLSAGGGASASDTAALGGELFSVVALLDGSTALRRALTDPSRSGDDKAGLAQRLLRGQVGDLALDVVAGVVRARWSADRDLADALEQLGTQALLASAERDDALDRVEDEVFRLSRIVAGDRGLAAAFADRTAGTATRGELVDRLLGAKVHPVTLALARQAVTAPRGRGVEAALAQVLDEAAERRQRLVAVVTAAVPLTAKQTDRLARALGRVYGRPVLVEVAIDPEVVGGVRVAVGDEVLDSTVAARLEEARRRLAG
jgi:F-type H+-transporting ATPase subunit delta